MNGAVTPLGTNHRKRLLQQRALAAKIVTLSKEMDYAVNRCIRVQEDEQHERNDIISKKLKTKGHKLLSNP